MAQQTAVEWLIEELSGINTAYSYFTYKVKMLQAKKMEKEQIIDAFNTGQAHEICINAEQYYNETYGKP